MDEINKIKAQLQLPLPGLAAHRPVFPLPERANLTPEQTKNYRKSAVALILFHQDNDLHSILIQRNEYKGAHSGQISLPGGKFDSKQDQNLIGTALRESEEEIGINSNELQHLGQLSEVHIPVSRFTVQPHVFYYPNTHIQLTPDPIEVKDILVFRVNELFLSETYDKKNIQTGTIQLKEVPCFIINNHIVWGATCLILNEFRLVLSAINK